MNKVKHVLGISGGKDSAALAIYMSQHYFTLDVDYYTCDTGKELNETYELIDKLNSVLGKEIILYKSIDEKSTPIDNPFDHFLVANGGYLPSPMARWCTSKMKLDPFENHIGNHPTISYVGIRGDENREGYISKKENIQTIFPFRKNIWSEDVIKKVLTNKNIPFLKEKYVGFGVPKNEPIFQKIDEPISFKFTQSQKVNALLNYNVRTFNKVVFQFLKGTNYPVGMLDEFPLIENEDIIAIDDVFQILENSGVGVPKYYLPIEFEVEIEGKIEKGTYSRSRSGCYFCFYQQKIEWVWLLEQHPDLFKKAMKYEKEGYNWMNDESLKDIKQPERVKAIKREFILRTKRKENIANSTKSWQDEILEAEGDGCASCFI